MGPARPDVERNESNSPDTATHPYPAADPQLRASISSITVVFTVSAIVLQAQYTPEHNNSDRFDSVLRIPTGRAASTFVASTATSSKGVVITFGRPCVATSIAPD